MFDKIKQTVQEASDFLRQQASQLGEGAKEKSFKVIEEWLQVFPKLEIYGLEITSFALSVAFSPSLEVEMRGDHDHFTEAHLQRMLEENRRNPAIVSVVNTIKTTYNLHRKTYANRQDPLIVKVRIRISPEIKVYIGKPIIE